MASPVYAPKKTKGLGGGHFFWATLVTAGIFILLPFTQMITSFTDDREMLRTADISEPPPELPPPPEEEPPEEERQEDKPDFEMEPEPISLTDLQVSLAAGLGGFGASLGVVNFDALGPSMDQLIFEVRDLDRTPRVIRQGRLEYPFELKRERIEGFVRLKVIIDERGRVRVAEVLEASHRAFVRAAVQAAEDSLFETPTRNGQAVRAYYILPIRFSLR